MKRRLTALLIALLVLALPAPAARAAQGTAMTAEEAMLAFRAFSREAAGKYVLQRAEDTVVLELTPAFGRLFASVMNYKDDSLYAYYAAELSPGDLSLEDNRQGNSADSFRLTVRSYSNMSLAGQYWPGDVSERLTLIGKTLVLAEVQGDGEPLAGVKRALFTRRDDAPGGTPYTPQMVRRVFGAAGQANVSQALIGDFNASWRIDGVEYAARLRLGEDGGMTALLDAGDAPPRLLRGGCAFSREENGVYTLFYMLSAADTGTMPHAGWARIEPDDGALVVSAMEDEDCLLLPEGEDMITYERGEDPLTLAFMRVADKRDGEDWLDVIVRDPYEGEETALRVMKDGRTTFAWPSNRNVFDLLALRAAIETGKELPVLYRAGGGVVDLLLVLDDIAADTRVLMARAAYFPLLGDYREQVEDGDRQGSRLSVTFDEAGEPAITLSNETDYPVRRTVNAAVQRRVGPSFTAVSGAGDRVTFEDWRADCVAVVDEALRLTPAVSRLFPGFMGTYEKIRE